MISEWTFTEGSLDENRQEGAGAGATTNYLGVDYGPLNFIVINSIQEDFQKIIVITHVEQIKDAFPVRIEVTKTGDGSTFDKPPFAP